MSHGRQKLYRSSAGVVAGVCSGFADYLSVDTALLRFAVVALTIVTGGGFALAYAALWLVLPCDYEVRSTVDVSPEEVSSEHYGSSANDARSKRKAAREHVAHTPPQPPASPEEEVVRRQSNTQAPATFGTVVGILLVVVGFAFLVPFFFPSLSPLQFWPLALVALGIARMVLPGTAGYRMNAFILGSILLFGGVVILLHTMRLIVLLPDMWVRHGWPFLAIAAGLLVLWRGTDLNGFAMAALAAIVVFCVVGVLFCSAPGPTQVLLSSVPFSKEVAVFGWRPIP